MSTPEQMPSSALPAAGRIDTVRIMARLLSASVVAGAIALLLMSWQQSVKGRGRVIAYAPLERQQSVEAPIDGRVLLWYVQEGDRVAKGDPIAELTDNDVDILDRIRRELDAGRAQVETAALSVTLTEARILSMETARTSALSNARLRVQMANDRRDAATRSIDAARARLRAAELHLTRQRTMHAKGLASKRDLELAELEEQTARADLDRADASLRAAKAEVRALVAERAQVGASNQANIESTQATLEKLKSERAKAEAELAKVEVRLARQEQMRVVAPRNGTILRLLAQEGTEMVKAGDPLLRLVPEAGSRAIEIYVDGNDAPLVSEGRHVRVQFEGWPAVQFVGWPSAAVGTFGGRVAFVDAHDDGRGRFRVVVVPDDPQGWPDARYLRQGVRANGWVLLDRVRLGFELWRQFNGFPPAVDDDALAPTTSKKPDHEGHDPIKPGL
ncbi:MAG: HlyD family efflux transporter periplasmic adaptor subunit [Myxococcota bacterium]